MNDCAVFVLTTVLSPVNVLAVITLAVNDPEASLATMVEAPFELEAVVAEFGIFVSDEPEPENVVAVITLAVNDPEASLATMVEAPFADAAVVLSFAKVPDVTLDALSVVRPDPLPIKIPFDVMLWPVTFAY